MRFPAYKRLKWRTRQLVYFFTQSTVSFINFSKIATQTAFATQNDSVTNRTYMLTKFSPQPIWGFPISLTRQRENQNSTEHTNSQHVGLDRAPTSVVLIRLHAHRGRLPTADCWLLVGVWLADWLSTAVVHYNNHRVLGWRHDHSTALPLLLLLLANVNLRAPQWIHSQKQTHSTGKPQRTHDIAQNSAQHVWASTSSLYWCALTLTWQTRWLCRLTQKFMSELAGSNDATTYCICMYVCI